MKRNLKYFLIFFCLSLCLVGCNNNSSNNQEINNSEVDNHENISVDTDTQIESALETIENMKGEDFENVEINENVIIVLRNEDFLDYLKNDLNIEGYPTLLSFNNFQLSFAVLGEMNEETFADYLNISFEDTLKYEDFLRTYIVSKPFKKTLVLDSLLKPRT